jgi:hypothetical protein
LSDLSVFAVDRLADLPQPDLRALHHRGNVFHAQCGAGLGLQDGIFDVRHAGNQADFADVDLLLAFFDKLAARIGVVIGELLLNLADA